MAPGAALATACWRIADSRNCVLFSQATAGEPAASVPATPPNGWETIAPFGDGDMGVALKRVESGLGVWDALFNRLEWGPRFARFYEQLKSAVLSLNVEDLFELLRSQSYRGGEVPEGASTLGAPLVYHGRMEPAGSAACQPHGGKNCYLFDLGPLPSGRDPRGLGTVSGRFQVTPKEAIPIPGKSSEKGYLLEGKGTGGLGEFRFHHFMGHLESFLNFIEKAAFWTVPDQQRTALSASQPTLRRPEELALLAAAQEALPATTALVNRYLQLESLAINRKAPSGTRYLELDVKVHLNLSRFRKDYPTLAEHLGDLEDLFAFSGKIVDKQGRLLTTFHTASRGPRGLPFLSFRLLVQDGAILPVLVGGENGLPDFSHPIRPSEVKTEEILVDLTGVTNRFGIRFDIDSVFLGGSYRVNEGGAGLSFWLEETPRIRVSGSDGAGGGGHRGSDGHGASDRGLQP